MKKSLIVSVLMLAVFHAGAAQAQRFETQQLYQRMNKLENDINFLQRQVARGEVAPVIGGSASGVIGNAGQMGAEIARIDEEMRSLRGQLEQVTYEIEQTNKRLDTMQKDIDYRFQEIADRSLPPVEPASAMKEPAAVEEPKPAEPAMERSQSEGSLALPEEGAPMSARDLYNHAFKLLNQTNYEGAEKSFKEFTDKFGDDPLVGNAWYWLGEAYYVQRDYVKAADSFRQGYQKLPDGPKAGDNLLKLAMSLSALSRGEEACVVLQQVNAKFASNSEALRNKARQEISRLGCK